MDETNDSQDTSVCYQSDESEREKLTMPLLKSDILNKELENMRNSIMGIST